MPDRKSFVLFQGLILPVGAILSAFMVLGNYGRLLGDDYCSIYIGWRSSFVLICVVLVHQLARWFFSERHGLVSFCNRSAIPAL